MVHRQGIQQTCVQTRFYHKVIYNAMQERCITWPWMHKWSTSWVFIYVLILHVLHFDLFAYTIKIANIEINTPLKMNTFTRTFHNMTCLGSHEVWTGGSKPLSLTIQMVQSLYLSIPPKSFVGLNIMPIGGKICV